MTGALTVPAILAGAIFGLTYFGILSERLHRTLVALIGAIAILALGEWLSFYSVEEATSSIDPNTIILLLGMMIIVGLFRATGFFEYLAVRTAKLARGRPWLLFVYLGLATSLVSMVLDNVTTIILMLPVTMSLADILGIPIAPFLIGEAILSNIGGVATLIGDPPNVLIGSAAGLTFTDFIVHLAPIVIIVWIAAEGVLLLVFRSALFKEPENISHLLKMDARRAITDRKRMRVMLAVLAGTILLFFLHDRIGLESGLVALIGASVGLILIRPNAEEALREVHWDVLLFFISLFIIVGGLEASGAFEVITSALSSLAGHGIILASLAILWGSAIMSAIVDNVPFTIAMLPIIVGLGERGIAVAPLWWALALGVGFGGNATPVGATANVLSISFSEKTSEPITASMWLRRGLPVAFVSCAIASVLDVLAIYLGLF